MLIKTLGGWQRVGQRTAYWGLPQNTPEHAHLECAKTHRNYGVTEGHPLHFVCAFCGINQGVWNQLVHAFPETSCRRLVEHLNSGSYLLTGDGIAFGAYWRALMLHRIEW